MTSPSMSMATANRVLDGMQAVNASLEAGLAELDTHATALLEMCHLIGEEAESIRRRHAALSSGSPSRAAEQRRLWERAQDLDLQYAILVGRFEAMRDDLAAKKLTVKLACAVNAAVVRSACASAAPRRG